MPDGVSIPGGPVFIGFPQPPDVPCDPSGDGWRGPPGPVGPQGVPGMDGGALSGLVNVLEHGATGDGTTDDTAAIQSALNTYAGKATVFVPDTGQPYIVTPLLLPTGTDLLLHGTLKAPAGAGASTVDVVSANNVTIRGHGTIDGNGAAGTYVNPLAALYIYQSSNVQVSGITIKNAYNFNIDALQSSHVLIDQVTMIGGVNSSGFAQGDDCWLTNCMIDGPSGDGGFAFYGAMTNSGAIGNTLKNAGIAGGTVSSTGLYVLSDAGSPNPCSNIVLANNDVYSCSGNGISVYSQTSGQPHTGIVIASNRTHDNFKAPHGFSGGDISVGNCVNVTITGNQVSDVGSNTLAQYGIHTDSLSRNISITGNQVYNAGKGGTTGIGLHVASSFEVFASGNYFYDTQGTPSMTSSIGGTAGVRNTFINNQCDMAITITPASDTILNNVINAKVVSSLPINAANDAAAAAAGVPPGGTYRAGSALMVRVV